MKKYNSFLGAFFSGDNGEGGYNAGYKKSALAKLYSSQDPAEQQMAVQGLARIDPEAAQKWQQDNEAQTRKHAQLLVSLGADNPVAVQAWKTRIKPELVRMYGDQAAALPDIPDESIMQYAQQLAGSGGGNQQAPAEVRALEWKLRESGYQPGSPEYKKAMNRALGIAEKWQYGQTASGLPFRAMGDEYEVMNPDTRQFEPYGNAPKQPPHMGRVINEDGTYQDISQLPPDEQDAYAQQWNSEVPAGAMAGKPTGSRPNPFTKPDAPKSRYKLLTPQEVINAGLPAGTSAQIGDDGKIEILNKPVSAIETPAQIAAKDARAMGKVEMSRVLKTMLDEYKALDESGGITNTDKGLIDNVGAYARASDAGQYFGKVVGSKDQSARDTINAMKPQVLSAIIAASGMSAKQLDSNAEMKLWLSATSDPQTSYQTVLKVTDNLLKKFTGKGIEQFDGSKPQAPAKSGAKKVGRFIIESD